MSEPILFSGKKAVLLIAVSAMVLWVVLFFTALGVKRKYAKEDEKLRFHSLEIRGAPSDSGKN